MNDLLFDSHCHFDFESFAQDRDNIWRNCRALGVKNLLIPGVSPSQWAEAARIAQACEGMICAAGVHPWWVDREHPAGCDAVQLEQLLTQALEHSRCRAIGECGLDKGIEVPMARQAEVLAVHLALASRTGCPVILHCHRAHNELLQLLDQQALPGGGVVHGFSGSAELAAQYWRRGFYLGIGGTITYGRARKTREAVRRLPLEALLLETDAPDMPPAGYQGMRNSPERLPEIAVCLAALRGEPLAEIAAVTTASARRLFA